jgi:hypothetical protein
MRFIAYAVKDADRSKLMKIRKPLTTKKAFTATADDKKLATMYSC